MGFFTNCFAAELEEIDWNNAAWKYVTDNSGDFVLKITYAFNDQEIDWDTYSLNMVGIQRVAAAKGVPYQSLISGLIHQFVEGDLVEKT